MLINLRELGSSIRLEFLQLESDSALRFVTHARLYAEANTFKDNDMKTFHATRKAFVNAQRELLKVGQ